MNRTKKGNLFIISSLLLWGFFPIIAKIIYNDLNYLYTLSFITFFSIFFFLFGFIKNKERKYFNIKDGWKDLLIATIFNGVIFYTILFYGISKTSDINSSIFGLSEVIFSYILFGLIFTKKKSSLNEIIGSILILFGGLIALFPGKFERNLVLVLQNLRFSNFEIIVLVRIK